MKRRNNDENGEAFAKKLKETPLSSPEMPLDDSIDENLTMQSHRDDHPDWFADVHVMFKTKESYFIDKLWNRRQNYWTDFHENLKKNDDLSIKTQVNQFVTEFKELMKDENIIDYDEVSDDNRYFDRTSETKMCDKSGKFSCSPYDGRECKGKKGVKHSINPYANNQQRLMFGDWQLDHK